MNAPAHPLNRFLAAAQPSIRNLYRHPSKEGV